MCFHVCECVRACGFSRCVWTGFIQTCGCTHTQTFVARANTYVCVFSRCVREWNISKDYLINFESSAAKLFCVCVCVCVMCTCVFLPWTAQKCGSMCVRVLSHEILHTRMRFIHTAKGPMYVVEWLQCCVVLVIQLHLQRWLALGRQPPIWHMHVRKHTSTRTDS